MTIAVFLLIIIIILICIFVKPKRLKIVILAGLGISILSFLAFILTLFTLQRTILITLLCVSYVSIIVFLILWNLRLSNKIFALLFIPIICAVLVLVTLKYQEYKEKIPVVSEQIYDLSKYRPFSGNNSLANLEEESDLILIDDLPVLDGATALYPVYASFVQAVFPEDQFKVGNEKDTLPQCSGTDEAFNNLLEGRVDIIFCAEPSDLQIKQFTEKGLDLKLIPIGKEAFVFFANKENTVDNLTTEDIKGIYSGKIKNWKGVNGANKSIKAFQRPKNSGSQTALEIIMGNTPIIKPRREDVYSGMLGVINQVAVYRNFANAIGYSFLFFSTEMVKNDQIKLLSINSVYPSNETIQNGSYPFSGNFFAIFIEDGKKNKNTDKFIKWILSRQGQALISKTGYVPLGRSPKGRI